MKVFKWKKALTILAEIFFFLLLSYWNIQKIKIYFSLSNNPEESKKSTS